MAVSVTITLTNTEAARFATFVGQVSGFGRDATAAECKVYIVNAMRDQVQQYEKQIAAAALTPIAFDPT